MDTSTAETLASAAPNHSMFPSLSFKTRFIGMLICLGVGIFIQVISYFMFFSTNYVGFGVCNCIGTILMLGA